MTIIINYALIAFIFWTRLYSTGTDTPVQPNHMIAILVMVSIWKPFLSRKGISNVLYFALVSWLYTAFNLIFSGE